MNETELKPQGRVKYREIVDEWRTLIKDGTWRSGDKLPTFAELTATRGLGTNTINRVFQDLEREGLVERRKGSGVYVAAPKLRQRASIGIYGYDMHADEGVHYWFEHFRGLRQALVSHNLGSYHLGSYHQAPDAQPPWDDIAGILTHAPYFTQPLRTDVDLLPAVCVMSPEPGLVCVSSDDYSGARTAVGHLVELGHSRIGWLMWPNRYQTLIRQSGYHDGLLRAGIKPSPHWVRPMRGFEDVAVGHVRMGYKNMQHWLATDFHESQCTAILVHNDECAFGAIRALREAGLEVPGDVSVIGFDGAEDTSRAHMNLTTLVVPLAEITEMAVDILVGRIEDPGHPAVSQVLPVHLRIGESTAPPKL